MLEQDGRSLFVLLLVVVAGSLPVNPVAAQQWSNVEDLRKRQIEVRQVCHNVIASVVSIDGASGVIISEGGLVLSQWHVSHAGREESGDRIPQGHEVPVVMANGDPATARLLGADREHDLSLLQLNGDGPYPHSTIDPEVDIDLGDWVVKLGHPGGYQEGRKPVVRLGRVVRQAPTEFITDCHVIPGDSGGPYFDLQGRLVGVIRTGSIQSIRLPVEMEPRTRITWSVTPNQEIHSKMERMRSGEVSDGTVRSVAHIYANEDVLALSDWKHGSHSLHPWHAVIANARESTISIFDGSRLVAFGTVVDSRGRIVTKASTLPETPQFLTNNGTEFTARIIGSNAAFDVAVLETNSRLPAVEWAQTDMHSVGTLLASPGQNPSPLSVGIVSVERRNLNGPFASRVIRQKRVVAEPPQLSGVPIEGRGLVVVTVEGNVALAGIEPADELTHLGETQINTEDDLGKAVAGRAAREWIRATVVRENTTLEFDLQLDNRHRRTRVERRFRIPTMFEHDAPVAAHECGGPIVNVDGLAIGITIARLGGHGCAAIPADCLRDIVRDLE